MNVLSLFDGLSAGRIALDRLNIKVDNYYASEVDKYAIKVAKHNYPDIQHLGDVTKISELDLELLEPIDILIGGSPCQGFSVAGKMKGSSTKCGIDITSLEQYLELKEQEFEFEGQSYLFWEYVRILRLLKPKYFFLENVRVIKKWLPMFNEAMCVDEYFINSALVSAQNRQRYYWTNLPNLTQPKDKGIVIADILEDEVDEKYYLSDDQCSKLIKSASKHQGNTKLLFHRENFRRSLQVYDKSGKTECLNTCTGGGRGVYVLDVNGKVYETKTGTILASYYKRNGGENFGGNPFLIVPEATKKGYIEVKDGQCFDYAVPSSSSRRGRDMSDKSNALLTSNQFMRYEHPRVRKLTPLECERLQTIPCNYTNIVSNSQRYKMIGNSWTIDVICHIFEVLKTGEL